LIKGDLDSLRTDVREYYASKVSSIALGSLDQADSQGVSILHDGSEYSTDLQKCIEEIESAEKENSVEVSRSSRPVSMLRTDLAV
jgi:thiamine pyrophosphokinase